MTSTLRSPLAASLLHVPTIFYYTATSSTTSYASSPSAVGFAPILQIATLFTSCLFSHTNSSYSSIMPLPSIISLSLLPPCCRPPLSSLFTCVVFTTVACSRNGLASASMTPASMNRCRTALQNAYSRPGSRPSASNGGAYSTPRPGGVLHRPQTF
ncbi:hypothetical protein NLG97_g11292 [Lecanicillium saksenae]|uniref:Uncharacterized protein n=1 Tax=Lecanicillium saksenae TaxID=468837 RepID=A0ACC1QAY8_9HYPO|nr:hypothetical protein NLG97_g11292 [Lecanicillium saksenae]